VKGEGSRYIKSRRIKFAFGEKPMSHYYVDDDVAMSHLIAMLSASFPPGEEAFIRSVRRFMGEIEDATLKDQVKGFIGQEMTHGREHRNLNEVLQAMGYPTKLVEVLVDQLQWVERLIPAMVPLAATAAAEHFTAILAERVLENREYIDRVARDDEVKGVLNWHAYEELEHKAVAFDVFRAMGGSEALRIGVAAAVIPAGIGGVFLAMALSAASDPAARRRPIHTAWRMLAVSRNPLFKGMFPELAQFLRPGFHPDDKDTDALLEASRDRLFGAKGDLARNMK
jgi:predicted metal-dependent hydrolase